MKKVLRVIGFVFGGLVVLLLFFCGYVASVGIPKYAPPITPKITVQRSEALVKRGEAIAQVQCMSCHANRDNRLTGKRLDEIPAIFGTIYSKNITQDKEKGIGRWTDGELMYFLRTSVRPDGSFVGVMPRYALMSDEDVKSVIAWLRSDRLPVQPTKEEAPEVEYSFFSKVLANTIMKPGEYPLQPILIPDSTDQVAFGKYIADGVADCYSCHSADLLDQDKLHPERSKGYYGGGIKMGSEGGKEIHTANLTFDEETGIGKKYTKAQFIQAVKMGVRPDGSILRRPMEPHPSLTDYEVGSIYEYLKTVPKLKNDIAKKNAEIGQ
ncbi:cytochrome c [Spirosoma sp. KNUC1025]|uniref:c-type cytochrome n=1 Tax=Spirosoma sp. KNUC1025 TaxID=2894082 RepID=UPI003865C51A|nr:cytochrome c [Spirosoma sp. KNUC1025]